MLVYFTDFFLDNEKVNVLQYFSAFIVDFDINAVDIFISFFGITNRLSIYNQNKRWTRNNLSGSPNCFNLLDWSAVLE